MKTFLALLCLLPALATAAPAWQSEVNIPRSGALKKMPPTHLRYELSWNGRVKAGTLDALLGKPDKRYPNHFVCQIYGGSTGWARTLHPLSVNYIGILNQNTLRPVVFVGNETEKKELKKYDNRFTASKVASTKTTTEDGKTKTQKRSFAHTPALDLFSALFQARSLPLAQGKTYVMPFYPISAPYLARLTVLGRENFGGRPAIKLDVKLQKIGPNNELVAYKKMKKATLWVSDDAWRVPLELRVEAFIGDVRMSLTEQKNL
ncbi:MAG: DUF3108 domain-containing protein [Verrucomicrobiales bacterium]